MYYFIMYNLLFIWPLGVCTIFYVQMNYVQCTICLAINYALFKLPLHEPALVECDAEIDAEGILLNQSRC